MRFIKTVHRRRLSQSALVVSDPATAAQKPEAVSCFLKHICLLEPTPVINTVSQL